MGERPRESKRERERERKKERQKERERESGKKKRERCDGRCAFLPFLHSTRKSISLSTPFPGILGLGMLVRLSLSANSCAGTLSTSFSLSLFFPSSKY
jgi:hypothetical protein